MAYIGKYYGNAKKQNHSIFSSVNSGTVYVYGQVDSAFDLIRVTSFAWMEKYEVPTSKI